MAVHCKLHAENFVCGGCIVLKMAVITYFSYACSQNGEVKQKLAVTEKAKKVS